ncbi:MAG: phosphatidylserine/phosphatidylglycerophosphate/cardiolipin synthase family protein [Bacteriovoracaceae bacterium]
MIIWKPLILTIALWTLPALGSIKAYFNQNQSTSYIDPYRNFTRAGDNLEQVLIDQVAQAKKTIYVAVQEFRLPNLARALIIKKNEGVDVRIVIEHDYNFSVLGQRDPGDDEYETTKLNELVAFVDINKNGTFEKQELETRDAIYMLRMAKIPIMDDTQDDSQGSGLMHHKFMVIDGKSTVISTANFTMSCVHGDMLAPASRGNANSMVVVQSTALANIFVNEFSQLWGNGKRGNFGHNKTYRGPQKVSVRGISITVQFSPTSEKYNWEESVNGLIGEFVKRATTSVHAALFVFSDQNIANELEKRSDAGVRMGFLVEPKFAYRDYSELLDMMGLQLLNPRCNYEFGNHPWKKAVAEVGMPYMPRGDVLHHKFGVIDRKTVLMGSQNWTESANYINDETLIAIEDENIADLYTREYQRLKKNSMMGVNERLKFEIDNQEKSCMGQGRYF